MNFNDVCRTCLTTQNLYPIFAGSVDDKRYSAAVFFTTGIKVAIDDGLPQQMCAHCINFSNASLKFRKQCKDAETRLLQLKNECDGAAETSHSEDFSNKDMRLELKADGDVTIKSEADGEIEDKGSGALLTTEENPLQLKPAGGAGAAPECTHTRPEEGPPCSTGHKQQFKLSSCFVRLERFPIEDLHHNMHTCKTCLMTFDCDSSLRNHSCTNSVQETNFNKVCNETAEKTHYKCDLCGKQYVQKSHIIRHLAAHNVKQGDEKPVPCSSDDAKFANTEEISYSDNVSETQSKSQSAMTILTGERPRPYICDVCSKEFSEKQHLIRHIRKLHDNMTNKYACEKCKKQFRRLSHLNAHIRVHTGEKPFTCDVCKKQFTHSSGLYKHGMIHTGEKRFTCDVCMKQFYRRFDCTRHRWIHTGEKPLTCDVCKKQFIWRNDLTKHRRIHTGEKPYCCSVCKKQFKQKHQLIVHMQTHTGEKPFTCDVCKKQFTRKTGLTMHRWIHTGEKPHYCTVCNKRFARKYFLTGHMRTHTGEKPFTCDICKKQFTRKTSLTMHRRIHTGEKPYCCTVCNERFAQKYGLTSHMRTHTGQKPFTRTAE